MSRSGTATTQNRSREALEVSPSPHATMLFHGTAVAFDTFDPTRFGTGLGYDDQGRGVYLTDDRDGFAKYFAREAVTNGGERGADVVLTVQLAPGTRSGSGAVRLMVLGYFGTYKGRRGQNARASLLLVHDTKCYNDKVVVLFEGGSGSRRSLPPF